MKKGLCPPQEVMKRYQYGANSRNRDIRCQEIKKKFARNPLPRKLGVNSLIRNYIVDNEFNVRPEEIIAYMKSETDYQAQNSDYFIGVIDSIRTDFIKKQEKIIKCMGDNLTHEEILKKLQKGKKEKKEKTSLKSEEQILIEQLAHEKARMISYIVERNFEISQEELLEYMQEQVPIFRRDSIPLLVNYIMEQLMKEQDAILEKMKQKNFDENVIESLQKQRRLLSKDIVRDIINQFEEEKRKQQGHEAEEGR